MAKQLPIAVNDAGIKMAVVRPQELTDPVKIATQRALLRITRETGNLEALQAAMGPEAKMLGYLGFDDDTPCIVDEDGIVTGITDDSDIVIPVTALHSTM